MALLRAKQIKVEGAAGTVLKVINSGTVETPILGLAYAQQTAADVAFTPITGITSNNVADAIAEVLAAVDGGDVSISALQAELDATQVSVGTDANGDLGFYANGNYIVQGHAEIPEDASDPENVIPAVPAVPADSLKVAVGKLDAALKVEETARTAADTALQTAIDNLTAADIAFTGFGQTDVAGALNNLDGRISTLSGLSALNFAGVLNATTGTLPATPEVGDVYRITTAGGDFGGELSYEVLVGDFIAYVGMTEDAEPAPIWVKFDNTDPIIGSTTAAITIAQTATGYDLTFVPSAITFADLGDDKETGFLKWDGSALVYVTPAISDITGLQAALDAKADAADVTQAVVEAVTLSGFGSTVTGALAATPVGDVFVTVNGLAVVPTAFSVAGTTLTMNEGVLGYTLDASDVVVVNYAAVPAI